MKIYERCPNCDRKLSGLLETINLVSPKMTEAINRWNSLDKEFYCEKCAPALSEPFITKFKQESLELKKDLSPIINLIPMTTSPAHNNWDYEIIDIVTTQKSISAGLISDFSTALGDVFEEGSKMTENKLGGLIEECKGALRYQSALLGGNAVISTNIVFNEIKSISTSVYMVCVTGTAIRVKNINSLGSETKEDIEKITNLAQRLAYVNGELNSYK